MKALVHHGLFFYFLDTDRSEQPEPIKEEKEEEAREDGKFL